ncbi:MAG: YdeI/OmpD-associated family protein [Gemmatimonadaceae bacterium]
MGKKDPRIDAYIAKQKDFAKPILVYLRDVVHEGCPQVEETLKWSSPAFMYADGILCGFAGFKEHAMFGFWQHKLLLGERSERAAGSYGRITSVDCLPSRKQLLALVRKAMVLNETGARAPRMAKPKKVIPMPADLKAALAKNRNARAKYDDFSPSIKREYLEWITGAKGDDTRARRVAQAVGWIAEGKSRNWKYK